MQSIPEEIQNQYAIGTVQSIEPVDIGLIHKTFIINSEEGTFVIQKLHPVLSSDEVAEDFRAVTEHLRKNKFPAPQAVLTVSGNILAKRPLVIPDSDPGSSDALDSRLRGNDKQEIWRMQTFVDGESFEKANAEMALNAGAFLAKYHAIMATLDYEFQSKKPLHQTQAIYDEFIETIENPAYADLIEGVQDEVTLIKTELPHYILPKNLPQHVIHGDPKISNILFKDDKAVAIVDLDTGSRHTPLVELGDAFRSWCGAKEDDPNNSFDLSIYETGLKGYLSEPGNLLSKKEEELIPSAVASITLELATRFLADYFKDEYFRWNSEKYSSRREHNLARARGQIALFKDLKEKLGI